jgi:hypothetical protein
MVVWPLIVWAIFGGLLGGIIGEWGSHLGKLVDEWREDKRRLIARTVLAVFVGGLSGVLLYLVAILLPEATGKAREVARLASGILGQFLIGLVGGYIGAIAVFAVINKWLGITATPRAAPQGP